MYQELPQLAVNEASGLYQTRSHRHYALSSASLCPTRRAINEDIYWLSAYTHCMQFAVTCPRNVDDTSTAHQTYDAQTRKDIMSRDSSMLRAPLRLPRNRRMGLTKRSALHLGHACLSPPRHLSVCDVRNHRVLAAPRVMRSGIPRGSAACARISHRTAIGREPVG
jgi:hypothetical protein